jgi:GAF domain-containing protein
LFNETKEALDQQRASGEVLTAISNSIADTKPVFDVILQSCQRLFAGDIVGVMLVRDGDKLDLASFAGKGLDELKKTFPQPLTDATTSGRAILQRRVVAYPDVDAPETPPLTRELAKIVGYRAIVAAPMIFEGNAIGALWVARLTAGAFSEKQLALLKTFAEQAVIAIQNARLFNETKEALEQQQASGEVLAAISSSIADTAPVFEKILSSAERLFAGKVAGINLVEEDGLIHLAAYHGPAREELERVFPLAIDRRSGSGTAVLSRRVIHYPDVVNGEDVPEISRRANKVVGFKGVVYAPMVWEGKAIGVIFVGRDYVGP